MLKELIVASSPHETKLAIVEDDQLAEVYFEHARQHSIAGSIYKGRVTRVLPGMQSAFVDIGLERDAFLYVSDFLEDTEEYDKIVTGVEAKVARMDQETAAQQRGPVPASAPAPGAHPPESAAPPSETPSEPATAPGTSAETAASGAPGADGQGPRPYGEERGRGRRRRSRRRRFRDRGFPESKYASRSEVLPSSSEGVAGRAPEESFPPVVLPGESLAKYQHLTLPSAESTGVSEPSVDEERQEPSSGLKEPAEETHTVSAPEQEEQMVEGEVEAAQEEHPPASPWIQAGVEPLPEAARAVEIPRPAESRQPEQLRPRVASLPVRPPDRPEPLEAEKPWAEEENPPPIAESAPPPAAAEGAAPSTEAAPEPPAVSEAAETGESSALAGEVAPPVQQAEVRGPVESARFTHRTSRRMRRRLTRGERLLHRAEQPSEHPGAPRPERPTRSQPLISDLLREGQEILVQIAKEPLGKKGARITSHIALPGRYVVYMPTVEHVGVSRKIASEEERQRLKRILLECKRNIPGGFIVRTAGEGRSEEDLRQDIQFLHQLWLDIRAKAERKPAPALIHRDLNLVERILRDQLSENFSAIWVDSEQEYEKILGFVQNFQPALVPRVKLYTKSAPIFEEFNIQEEIDKALKPKVWLKSGGYIVINQTEALVAIDVNTGKYVGKTPRLEDTILKTNVDAIKEIVRQIRLRDLGGIIVIDFIDMDERKNRARVMQALDEALRHDRAPSKILAFNDFGLVAITRKRVKQSLERTLCAPCAYCSGSGYLKSPHTVAMEILAEAGKLTPLPNRRDITLRVNPEVARYLKQREVTVIQEIEEMTHHNVLIKSDPTLHQESFDFN